MFNCRSRSNAKTALQIRQAVERLYYGLLINQQQRVEATAKLDVANLKLYDVESALQSGKTIGVSKAGCRQRLPTKNRICSNWTFSAKTTKPT
ncbi:hypothetical protein [Spirosoma telluris]|uniref:hypothetical protein n=1 Tax=Spirosoma telluris TaxID=2183553 RepID=UPI0018DD5F04